MSLKCSAGPCLLYLRFLRWYASFIFEDVLTFGMSRDLFLFKFPFQLIYGRIKRRNDVVLTNSHRTRKKKCEYKIDFSSPFSS